MKKRGGHKVGRNDKVSIESLSSFLYDLSLLNDCLALSTIEEYSNYRFTPYFFYKTGRPLKKDYKLYLNKINHNSPLFLEVALPLAASAAGIPWLILQSLEKIQSWKMNRELLKLNLEKAKLDVIEKRTKVISDQLSLEEQLTKRESLNTWKRVLKRLENNNFSAEKIEIDFMNPEDL